MKRVRLALIVVLLTGLSAEAVTLAYLFEQGQSVEYRSVFDGDGQMVFQIGAQRQSEPLRVEGEERRSLTVLEQNDDGTWWVESRCLGGTVKLTAMGSTSTEDIVQRHYRLRMNAQGDVFEVQEERGEGGAQLDLGLGSVLSASATVAFPAGDVKVGDSWEKTVEVEGEDGEKRTAKASNRLRNVEQAEGRPLAVIESDYEVPIPPTSGTIQILGTVMPIKIEGVTTGRSTVVWDLGRGQMVGSDGRSRAELLLNLGLLPDPAEVTLDLNIAIDLEE